MVGDVHWTTLIWQDRTRFLRAFAVHAGANLHAEILYGRDAHHMAEAIFKGLAKAVDAACQRQGIGRQLIEETRRRLLAAAREYVKAEERTGAGHPIVSVKLARTWLELG